MKDPWFQNFYFNSLYGRDLNLDFATFCMSKVGLYSQGNSLKKGKILRQRKTDGY